MMEKKAIARRSMMVALLDAWRDLARLRKGMALSPSGRDSMICQAGSVFMKRIDSGVT